MISTLCYRDSNRKNIFTLIELLVVIAIIAILAGMLLPALTSARNKAKTITCLGNIKQMGTLVVLYNSDSDGFIPQYYLTLQTYAIGTDTYSGHGYLGRDLALFYMGKLNDNTRTTKEIAKVVTPNSFWICPETSDPLYSNGYVSSYGFNSRLVLITNNGFHERKARNSTKRNRMPSKNMVVAENIGYRTDLSYTWPPTGENTTDNGTGKYIHVRHNWKTNVAFLDGHAETRPMNRIPSQHFYELTGAYEWPTNSYFWTDNMNNETSGYLKLGL